MTPLRTTQLIAERGFKIDSPSKSVVLSHTAAIPNPATSANVIIIGDLSVTAAETLTDSCFVGSQSGSEVVGGNGTVCLGNLTLNVATTAIHQTLIGDSCGRRLTTGTNNSILGYVAGHFMTTGSDNCIFGSYAGAYGDHGDNNILIGSYAGAHSEIAGTACGDNNIAIGETAYLYGEGSGNIALGFETLHSTLGDNIIAIGNKAGFTVTSAAANNNIYIGEGAGWSTGVQKTDAVNQIVIGAGAVSTQDNETVIGNTSTTKTLLRGDLTCGSINIDIDWIGAPGPTNGAFWRGSGNLNITSDTNSISFLSNTNGLYTARLFNTGRFLWNPPASAAPDDNGQVCLEFTSNTTITLKGKGSDGTVRSVALTIA
jgi:hypothetical protein